MSDQACPPTKVCVIWSCRGTELVKRGRDWICPKCLNSYGECPHPDLRQTAEAQPTTGFDDGCTPGEVSANIKAAEPDGPWIAARDWSHITTGGPIPWYKATTLYRKRPERFVGELLRLVVAPLRTEPDALADRHGPEVVTGVEHNGVRGVWLKPGEWSRLLAAEGQLLESLETTEGKHCTCQWESPEDGSLDVWPAELDPACPVHSEVRHPTEDALGEPVETSKEQSYSKTGEVPSRRETIGRIAGWLHALKVVPDGEEHDPVEAIQASHYIDDAKRLVAEIVALYRTPPTREPDDEE